jgi:hypothetical protein
MCGYDEFLQIMVTNYGVLFLFLSFFILFIELITLKNTLDIF